MNHSNRELPWRSRWRFTQTFANIPEAELKSQLMKIEEKVYHLNNIPGRQYNAVVRTFHRPEPMCDLEFSYTIAATTLERAYLISSNLMSDMDFEYLVDSKPKTRLLVKATE